jgi:hypothetical protein
MATFSTETVRAPRFVNVTVPLTVSPVVAKDALSASGEVMVSAPSTTRTPPEPCDQVFPASVSVAFSPELSTLPGVGRGAALDAAM